MEDHWFDAKIHSVSGVRDRDQQGPLSKKGNNPPEREASDPEPAKASVLKSGHNLSERPSPQSEAERFGPIPGDLSDVMQDQSPVEGDISLQSPIGADPSSKLYASSSAAHNMIRIPPAKVDMPENTHLFEQSLKVVTGDYMPASLFQSMRADANQPILDAQNTQKPDAFRARNERTRGTTMVLEAQPIDMETVGVSMALSNIQTFKSEMETNAQLIKDNVASERKINQESLEKYEKKLQEAQEKRDKAQKGLFGRIFSAIFHLVKAIFSFLTFDVGTAMADVAKAIGQIAGPGSALAKKITKFLGSKFMKALSIVGWVVTGLVMATGLGGIVEAAGKTVAKLGGKLTGKAVSGFGKNLSKMGDSVAATGARWNASNINIPRRIANRLQSSPVIGKVRNFRATLLKNPWFNSSTKRGLTTNVLVQGGAETMDQGANIRQAKYLSQAEQIQSTSNTELTFKESKQEALRADDKRLEAEVRDQMQKAVETLKSGSESLTELGNAKALIVSKKP